jgi:hypothetical protein
MCRYFRTGVRIPPPPPYAKIKAPLRCFLFLRQASRDRTRKSERTEGAKAERSEAKGGRSESDR